MSYVYGKPVKNDITRELDKVVWLSLDANLHRLHYMSLTKAWHVPYSCHTMDNQIGWANHYDMRSALSHLVTCFVGSGCQMWCVRCPWLAAPCKAIESMLGVMCHNYSELDFMFVPRCQRKTQQSRAKKLGAREQRFERLGRDLGTVRAQMPCPTSVVREQFLITVSCLMQRVTWACCVYSMLCY